MPWSPTFLRPVRDDRGDRPRLGVVEDLERQQRSARSYRRFGSVGIGDGRLVPGLERLGDVVGLVAEVEDERVGLLGVDPVEAREGLDRGEPDERLVHEHRVQERLVVPGLELLGHDRGRRTRARRSAAAVWLSGKPFIPRLGEVEAGVVDACRRTRRAPSCRRSPSPRCSVDGLLVADGVEAGRGDDHRLALAADLVAGVLAEVLDDDLGLLGEVVGVERDEPGDRAPRLAGCRTRGRR